MLSIILVVLAGAVLGYSLERFLGAGVLSFLGCFVGTVLAIILGTACPTEDSKTDSHRLVSFNDGIAPQGHFVLGTGTIRNVNYYFFYQQDHAGGIRQGRVRVDEAVIFEEDRNDGLLEVHVRRPRGGWRYWVLRSPDEHYRILVPRGTIIRNFTADLE